MMATLKSSLNRPKRHELKSSTLVTCYKYKEKLSVSKKYYDTLEMNCSEVNLSKALQRFRQ